MIEGAKWKKWLWFYLPMGMFILALLFPFYWMLVTTVRPDSELYRPWNHPLYMPFWTTQPTLEHVKNLLYETLFGVWMWNTMLIALAATLISLFCGVIAGYALARLRFRYAGLLGTAIFVTYLVPQTLLFIPLAEIIHALVFLSSPEQKTVPVGVVSELIRGDVFFWGPLMAGALIGSIPVAIVYSFFVEYYVTGMTGSVKG